MSSDYLESIEHNSAPVMYFDADRVVIKDKLGNIVYDTTNPAITGFILKEDK